MLDDRVILRTLDVSVPSSEILSPKRFDEGKFLKQLADIDSVPYSDKEDFLDVASFNAGRFNVLRSELELAGESLDVMDRDRAVHDVDGRPAPTSVIDYIEEVGEVRDKSDDKEFER